MESHDNSTTNAVSISYLLIETEAFEFQQNALARVFANGIQKCVVLITVQARDSNNQTVTIPDDLNVNVVPYTTATGNWVSNMTPPASGFQPFPEHLNTHAETESTNAPPVVRPEDVQVFRRYVSYTAVPDGSVNQFAAQVKLPNVTYVSNHRDVPYGGAGQNSRFNSAFRLRSVQPPQYATYNGGLLISGPVEVFSGVIESYTTKVQNWYASLRYPGTSTAVAIHTGSSGSADSSLDENKATAFGDAGSATAKKNVPSTNQLGRALNTALSTIRQPRAGSIAVAVGMYARVSEYFPARQISHYQGAMDVYGNPLRLAITLTSDRAHRDPWVYQLSIDWAGAKAEQE